MSGWRLTAHSASRNTVSSACRVWSARRLPRSRMAFYPWCLDTAIRASLWSSCQAIHIQSGSEGVNTLSAISRKEMLTSRMCLTTSLSTSFSFLSGAFDSCWRYTGWSYMNHLCRLISLSLIRFTGLVWSILWMRSLASLGMDLGKW